MRIAFVIVGTLDHVSGGFHYDRMVITQLQAQGHEVDVIALPWRRYGRQLLDNLAPWPLQARQYDVVIEDQLAHPALIWRNRRLRRAGLPVVSLVHNLTSCQPATRLRSLVRGCERAYFRGVDAVIAVCASTAADARACAGWDLRVHVAYAGRDAVGGDAAAVAARAQAAGPLRAVFVGQVAPHKGLHRALAAIAAVADATLDVAGSLTADAGYVERIRAQAARLQLGDRLRLHDQLGRTALAALLARSHVLVMPSDREAYPLAALEALGAGLPVLLTSAGGTAELLGDGRAGQLIAPDDARGWAAAITGLARDRTALATAGQAALLRHRAHGTWADTAAGVAAFLEGILDQNRRRKT
jgi:glycosyltransferase involved in cell wall biosynthesis